MVGDSFLAGYQGFDQLAALELGNQGVVGVCWGHQSKSISLLLIHHVLMATFENAITPNMFIDRTARSGCLVSPL